MLLDHEHVGQDVVGAPGGVAVARARGEPLDDLEVVRHLVRGEPHLPRDLRVLVALELLDVVAHHDVGGRVLETKHPELDAEALGEGPGGDPGRVERLDEGEHLLHRLEGPGAHGRHVLEGHPQEPVLVEVLDDRLADLDRGLVRHRHAKLPE